VRRRPPDRLHLAAPRLGPGLDRRCASPAPRPAGDPAPRFRARDLLTSQIHLLDPVTGQERPVAGETAWETGPRWLPDGSGLLIVSDRDGWFQVALISAEDGRRTVLTTGQHEHGEPGGGWGYVPLPSPDGRRFAHVEIRDGLVDVLIGDLPGGEPGAAGGEPGSATAGVRSAVVNPFEGVWLVAGWMPDSQSILAIGRNDRSPDDLWLLPVPEAAAQGARPRQLTRSLPIVVDIAHFAQPQRVSFAARDGMRIEGTLYLPGLALGDEPARVPCVVHSHGGPTSQALRDWFPFRQLVAEAGMAFLSVDFRGSTGYGRDFRWANRGEWGHADAQDVIDAARWAAAQPWCDGRLAHYGASYGGYMTLCVLTEEPSLWRAGIDLYGDSEIVESYRHGDRLGRIDLERMMGQPDDPEVAPAYRRGSPLYRAERIEAPLLILHGRKDKRVVPLMTEKMVERLEIESKHYQVHWYDEEAHGWQKRENRRDAWKRCLDFLKRHVLDQVDEGMA
jgi:dienelactone hydrolase